MNIKKLLVALGLVVSIGAHAATPVLTPKMVNEINYILNQVMFDAMCKKSDMELLDWSSNQKTTTFNLTCGHKSTEQKGQVNLDATQTSGNDKAGIFKFIAKIIANNGDKSERSGEIKFAKSKEGKYEYEVTWVAEADSNQ